MKITRVEALYLRQPEVKYQCDSGQDALLVVTDHGPGIPAEAGEAVFQRFYRADPARGRAAGSTGLGLSIVSAIVAAHHGQVRLDGTPGGGATFTVRLPLYVVAAAENAA